MVTRKFLVKAGTGKQIAVVLKGMTSTFNTNISSNLPTKFFIQGLTNISKTTDTTGVRERSGSFLFHAGPPGRLSWITRMRILN